MLLCFSLGAVAATRESLHARLSIGLVIDIRRQVLHVLAAALLAVSCGGDSDDPDDIGGDSNGANDSSQSSNDRGAGVAGNPPALDPSSMPPPGEAHVEVDGQTFVFKQSEMLESPFTCEIRDDGITINFQSDRHDMLLQGATLADGSVLANTTVVPEESDFRYDSTTGGGNGGGVAVEGTHVIYSGRFDATPKDDLASFTDVGTGRVAVTCP